MGSASPELAKSTRAEISAELAASLGCHNASGTFVLIAAQ
jgi:hypothetical protein